MLRGLLKMFLLSKLLGGAGRTGNGDGNGRGGCGGIGCLGLVIVLVLLYFLFRYLNGGTETDF